MNTKSEQKKGLGSKSDRQDKSYSLLDNLPKENLFGVGITNASQHDILEYILHVLEDTDKKMYIVTPNPEILVYAKRHKDFCGICNRADIAIPDGVGLLWAAKILGKSLRNRVTGVTLMENLCGVVAKKPVTVGFLGGGDNVAEKTAERLIQKYPGLKVTFVAKEWNTASLAKGAKAAHSKIDILFVAFGFPKQEEFIAQNLFRLPVRVMMGVGGAFDYISGTVSRAPVWVQKVGFEWFYRLIIQPWRVKRQLELIRFIWLVLLEKLKVNIK